MPQPVLISGAGPTGLNLALQLARRNIPFRIVSKDAGPGEHSRAMVVHARTLEFYLQLGFAREVVADGIVTPQAHIRERNPDGSLTEVATLTFPELGRGLSPFPFPLAYPQDDHEKLLLSKLQVLGHDVEWNTALTAVRNDADSATATLTRDNRAETFTASYICGCDGAHSGVRQSLGIGFPGGTYDQMFYVADVKLDRPTDPNLEITLAPHILALMFPVRSSGMQRLIGLIPPEFSHRTDLTFDDIREPVERSLGIRVTNVNWFSPYRVHHRVAEHFRIGRCFLLGDAGHIHSPVGGQGMNTGIGDAINLGWKLANVLQGRAAPAVLDTYEPERIAFARALVATTDRAFTPMIAPGLRGEITRRLVARLAFSMAGSFDLTREAVFRLISQLRIKYRRSALSEGKAGGLHGGDRLPWIASSEPNEDSNFAPLQSLDWQLHIIGDANRALVAAAGDLSLATHTVPFTDAAHHAGFARNAAYLVRPDTYIALCLPTQNPSALHDYVRRFALRFTAP